MYKKTLIFVFSVLAFLASSCDSGKDGWNRLSPEFDKLNAELDSLYFYDRLLTEGGPIVDRIDSIATAANDSDMTTRLFYWRSLMIAKADPDSSKKLIRTALERIDSTRSPYEHARYTITNRSFKHDDYINQYSRLKAATDYFIKIHDRPMQLLSYRTLTNFFLTLSDFGHYLSTTQKIEKLCYENGWNALAAKSKINFALYAIHERDTVKAAEIIQDMLLNPHITSDSTFMRSLYVNLATLRKEPLYLQRAIDVSPKSTLSKDDTLTLQFAMAQMYEQRGEYAQADSLLSFLIPIIEQHGDASAKAVLHDIYSSRSEREGNFESAFVEHRKSERWRDSLYSPSHHARLSEYNLHQELERVEKENQQKRLIEQSQWAIAILVILFGVVSTVFFLKNRANRLKLEKTMAEARIAELDLELEKEKRSMVAMGLAITETDELANQMVELVDDMHRKGVLSDDSKKLISQKVKQSAQSRKEIDNFKTAYEKLHPEFLHKLKQKYPALSEGDTRLSLYISVGLDTKQIAQLTHVQPDSVKKSRQRLRQRMGLSPDESLENLLRNLL